MKSVRVLLIQIKVEREVILSLVWLIKVIIFRGFAIVCQTSKYVPTLRSIAERDWGKRDQTSCFHVGDLCQVSESLASTSKIFFIDHVNKDRERFKRSHLYLLLN